MLYLFVGLASPVRDTAWITTGIDLTINNKFDQALAHFQKEMQSNDKDYRVYFYVAATLNSKMTHFETWGEDDAFEKMIEKTIDLIELQLSDEESILDSDRAMLLFYLGSAYGYRAYHNGQLGKWFPALSNGIKASKLLNQAIEIDSTLYDAYLGIGTYKYWRYSKLKFISWLPFIPDDRKEGIEMIKKAISHSSYSKYMAMHQLVYILLDYGYKQEALSYAEELVQIYPNSQFMWWAKAHAHFKNRNFGQAEIAYLKLCQLIENDEKSNPSHLLSCKLKLALIHFETKNYTACHTQCSELLLFSEKINLKENDEKYIKRARNLLDRCEENLK
jgi:tetratricopeptide (TPR) repeat protein